MLHDMIMEKFKLEANYPLNLSAKMPSFDDIFDITDDNEIRTSCIVYARAYNRYGTLKGSNTQMGTILVVWAMDGKLISFLCQLLLFTLNFPLAFQVLCCRHLMMTFFEKKRLFTPDGTTSSLDVDPRDGHERIAASTETYRAMMQEWYFKRRELADNMMSEIIKCVANKVNKKRMKSTTWHVYGVNHYQYQVSDGRYNREVDFQTGTCQCRKWQLSEFPCGPTFTSSPERKFVDGLVATVDPIELDSISTNQEALDEEACLEEQILSLMHRFADRFTNRRPEINRLMILDDHPLIEYGRYALGCMTGADMKKVAYLKSVRDELLRSMEEKRQLIANYREM
ncbi:hypothetical protein Tco_0872031 [Tanacetum coccineum]